MFLKGLCRGEVLSAVGKDANNQMYPLAQVVVPVENQENWKWILDLLLEDIDMGQGAEYRKLFWFAAKATTTTKFEDIMNEIKLIVSNAYEHLMGKKNPNTWSSAFFREDSGSDAIENGVSESFSATIVEARKKPIIAMLEDIRVFWGVIPGGIHQYESRWLNEVYAVDLDKRTCGCRSWQLTGIPCVHAISVILCLNGNTEEYVAIWYTTQMFGSCYRYNVKPINGRKMWPAKDMNTILPPKRRTMPGRPKINRRKCISERSDRHTGQGKGRGEGQGQGHGEAEDVGVDLEEEVEGDSEEEVGGDSEDDLEVQVEQVVDEEVVNPGNQHVVAPTLKMRKCGPSQRNTKLRLRRKVVTKDDTG
ncbi:unnamed protein product [Lactuca saligna]|uniref:SWIM-type domain-containing protein n=1 Tax=Lactuca saligna TaxID=75948 RepID=A0AA36A0W7_LACSI|nr:unnamed protein product [Lactuca saligna]